MTDSTSSTTAADDHVLAPGTRTRPEHGDPPTERSLQALLACGVVMVDKPAGPTSHQLSAWARDLLGLTRLGHGGTLDPFATGVLPLLAGRARRLTALVLGHEKVYVAVLRFSGAWSPEGLRRELARLRGVAYNVPPLESAVKVQVRTRRLHELRLLDHEGQHAVIEMRCDAGTYVRTLAEDLGLLLGAPCQLVELRRTRSGAITDDQCVTMQDLTDAAVAAEAGDERALRQMIWPIEALAQTLPTMVVKDAAAAHVARGAPVWRPGLVRLAAGVGSGERVACMALDGSLLAVMRLSLRSDDVPGMARGEVASPEAVLADPERWPLATPEAATPT